MRMVMSNAADVQYPEEIAMLHLMGVNVGNIGHSSYQCKKLRHHLSNEVCLIFVLLTLSIIHLTICM